MIRDKRLFAFLKDRHILNPRGAKDLHEYMNGRETRTEHGDRARLKKKLSQKKLR
jgi:hypothetical protein